MICILPKDKFVGIRTVPPRQATCFGWLNHPVLAAISWWSHQKSHQIHSAWWLSPTPLKNDGVSWDDDIPNMMGKSYKIDRFQTTNQPKNVNPQLVTPQQRASFRTSLVSSGLPACRWSFPHGYSHDIPIIDGAHRWFVFMKQWWIWKIPVQKISFWAGECKCNIDSKIWKH